MPVRRAPVRDAVGSWMVVRPQRMSIHTVLTSGYPAVMGALLQIRDVPDEVRRVLKARAAARGESLNRYLLELLERDASRPSVQDVLDRAARRAEQATESALAALHEEREEREGELADRESMR